eukprot:TRINITY_DN61608_c0_g1_i1.p1 TRINITY_DN61608_c0_g1~~TRINITY_DN61608_c0_g1_i1.p1  ORF type:complete len:441 (-),score=59.72 TRINITY_DN61608_c0_g1_i1:11-1333(-)
MRRARAALVFGIPGFALGFVVASYFCQWRSATESTGQVAQEIPAVESLAESAESAKSPPSTTVVVPADTSDFSRRNAVPWKPFWDDPPLIRRDRSKREKLCAVNDAKQCQTAMHCMWHSHNCTARAGMLASRRCNDGHRYVQCFDVAACAKDVPDPTKDKRWAFVFAHNLRVPFKGFTGMTLPRLHEIARRLGNTDVVLIIPTPDLPPYQIPDEEMAKLRRYDVVIKQVPWWLPPGMKHDTGWCGPQDFIKLHAFTFEEYDVILHLENDVEVTGYGDVSQVLRCASKGYFIVTSGPMAPINTGIWAVKPNRSIFDVSVHMAQRAEYDEYTGWGDSGHAPFTRPFPGSGCGQGFLHTLFFKQDSNIVAESVAHVGATMPQGVMVDRCTWNHQEAYDSTKTGFRGHLFSCDVMSLADCTKIVMLHKAKTPCKKGVDYSNYTK